MSHRTPPRRTRRSAFTLMEMLVVVAIIVVLAGTGGFLFMQRLEESKIKAAQLTITQIENAAQAYYINFGTYPATLDVLVDPAQSGGRAYLDADKLKDPWGNVYVFDPNQLHPSTGKPKVGSLGPGGNEPISNW